LAKTKARDGLTARQANHVDVRIEHQLKEAIRIAGRQWHNVSQKVQRLLQSVRHHLKKFMQTKGKSNGKKIS